MQASRCLFHDFNALTHFLNHNFSKLCFLPTRGARFCKTTSSTFNRTFHFFDPQTASIRACFVIWFVLFALLAAPNANFSLLEPIKNLQTAHDLCTFSLQGPVSKNECMHHTGNFVNFVYDLLFSLCLPCSEHPFLQNILSFFEKVLPALCGKHDFESGTKAKSWKICLLGPPVGPICTLFAPFIAPRNLQNQLEKCAFFVYDPFSEAMFSIVCFIACI